MTAPPDAAASGEVERELEEARAALSYVTVLDEVFSGDTFYSLVGTPILPGERHYAAFDAAWKWRAAHARGQKEGL